MRVTERSVDAEDTSKSICIESFCLDCLDRANTYYRLLESNPHRQTLISSSFIMAHISQPTGISELRNMGDGCISYPMLHVFYTTFTDYR
jgi:hypothetical protein